MPNRAQPILHRVQRPLEASKRRELYPIRLVSLILDTTLAVGSDGPNEGVQLAAD
jgi:hypothetical protein